MACNRTMAAILEAPTEGYEDAIVIPEITANNFEIKHGLLNLVQNKQFFGNDKEDPHRYFGGYGVPDDADNEMFDVNALDGEEVFVAGQNENVVEEVVDVAQVSTAATTATITTEEITLAQALEALKTLKPKDKGKGIMVEEPVKTMKKKDLIILDEETASKLRLRLVMNWLQDSTQGQEELYPVKKGKIISTNLIKQRKKGTLMLKVQKRENKPTNPTATKEKSCSFQEVNTFVELHISNRLVEGSSKRAEKKYEDKRVLRSKGDKDKDTATLQSLMEVIPDEE
ncbi:hypothetical protein Tco_0569405 [Tanacetum coccineum]